MDDRAAARVAWQGSSHSRREISCMTNDIVFFELRGDAVAVLRTPETYGETEIDTEPCEPEAAQTQEIERIEHWRRPAE